MGRVIVAGAASGAVLKSEEPINFLGAVDAGSGAVKDPSHPLHGRRFAGAVLAFPHGSGSSVGAYTVYALRANGVAPAAMVCRKADATVVAGCAVAGIPLLIGEEFDELRDGEYVSLDGARAGAPGELKKMKK